MPVRLRLAAPMVLLLALAACSDADPVAAPVTAPPVVEPAVATPAPAVPAVDWNRPVTTALGEGWSLGPCEGDAPLVCFSYAGAVRGVGEVASFPAESLPAVRDALAGGGGAAEALDAHAREHLASMRDDRTKGCGAGYDFRADEPRPMRADGAPAIKTAFTGGGPGAPPTERVVRWVGLRDGQLVSLVIHATEDGACTPGLGSDLSLRDLALLEPVLDRVVQASPLPTGDA